MTLVDEPRLLILETSGRIGYVALAQGATLLGTRRLDEARRHARDLAPATAVLLEDQGWRPRDLHGVIVSRGPGSYTGLRVGLMSAKALAYATRCALLAVETFAAIARQAPAEAGLLDVLADAQQEKVYVQRFRQAVAGWEAVMPLVIRPFAEWASATTADLWATGPGLRVHEAQLPASVMPVPEALREPLPASLLQIGLERYRRGERDDVWMLEPLYLRPSAAEEQWQRRCAVQPHLLPGQRRADALPPTAGR